MTRINVLSDDPDEAVQWLVDADIIRMPIEIGQVLLSIWNKHAPGEFEKIIEYLNGDPWLEWANESVANYEFLWNLGMDLLEEHWYRFGSHSSTPYKHGMSRTLERCGVVPPLPNTPQSPMPISPEQARLAYNVEGAYHVYSYRTKPNWKVDV